MSPKSCHFDRIEEPYPQLASYFRVLFSLDATHTLFVVAVIDLSAPFFCKNVSEMWTISINWVVLWAVANRRHYRVTFSSSERPVLCSAISAADHRRRAPTDRVKDFNDGLSMILFLLSYFFLILEIREKRKNRFLTKECLQMPPLTIMSSAQLQTIIQKIHLFLDIYLNADLVKELRI